jgi:broad specificity phosphatase PhoE
MSGAVDSLNAAWRKLWDPVSQYHEQYLDGYPYPTPDELEKQPLNGYPCPMTEDVQKQISETIAQINKSIDAFIQAMKQSPQQEQDAFVAQHRKSISDLLQYISSHNWVVSDVQEDDSSLSFLRELRINALAAETFFQSFGSVPSGKENLRGLCVNV